MPIVVTTRDDIDHDELHILIRIPRNDIARMNRREMADTMYDLLVAPLDLEADTDFNLRARAAAKLNPPRALSAVNEANAHIPLPDLPEGMIVLWCNKCFYSVVYDEQVMLSYGPHWEYELRQAINHEH